MKSAVEWLLEQYENNFPLTFDAINKAKEMEKEQIKGAYIAGGYNNTDREAEKQKYFIWNTTTKPLNPNKMEPKEKAKELVNKFMFTPFNIQENTDDFKFKLLIQSKQCALIAVDELIKYSPNKPNDEYDPIDYFKRVKQEIRKL